MTALLLLGVTAFCVFGFMATFEPLDASIQLTWRIVYGMVGITCLGLTVALLRPGRKAK